MQETQALLQLLVMLVMDPRTDVLVVLLLVAAVTDCRSYKIPNWLTFSGAAFSLIAAAVFPITPDQGLLWSCAGLAVGLLLALPLYALQIMGAGDAKLIAMVGAFLGTPSVLYALLSIFIVGGIAALGFALFHRVTARMLANIKGSAQMLLLSMVGGVKPDVRIGASQSVGKLPYGVSICVGTIGYVIARQFGYV